MGSGVTAIGFDPIPAPDDAAQIPNDFSMYAEAIAHKIVHWVADQAERDVLYASPLAPIWVASPTALWLKVSGSGGSSVWKTVWSDSGAITSGFTNGPNFNVTGGYVRKLNDKFVQCTVNTQRKITSATIASSGNIVGDPIMFTLPNGYWPAITTPGIIRFFTGDGRCEIDTSGVCRLLSGTPSYTIDVDETCVVAASFFTS
jgi:hypothetical protein